VSSPVASRAGVLTSIGQEADMLEVVPVRVGRALRRARAGEHKLAVYELPTVATLEVASEAFVAGGALPVRFTADGEKVSPPLSFRGVPAEAQSLVLLIEDADSPSLEPLVHAIAWNLPAHDGVLPEAALSRPGASGEGPALGRNSFLRAAYLPPDPPPGHGPHRYAFQVFALDTKLAFSSPPGRRRLLGAMRGHVLAKGSLEGTYERDGHQ
jgi:Raf kinase inhibitor-like YbhB/YbcL family protein